MRPRLATGGSFALAALALAPLLLGGCALRCSPDGGPAALCGEPPEQQVDFQRFELTHVRVDNPTPQVGDDVVFSARAIHEAGFAVDVPHVFRWFFGEGSRPINDRVDVRPDPARPGEFTSETETRVETRRCGREGRVCADQSRAAALSLYLRGPNYADRVERTLRVHTAAEFRESRPPVARFNAARDPSVGTVVRFDATRSSDPDGDEVVAWRWDFGDGQQLDQNYFDFSRFRGPADGTAAHSYPNEPASYRVTLTVRDEVGRESQPIEQTVTVIPEGSPRARPPAIGIFAVGPNPALVNQTVAFAAETVDPDGDIDRYEWDLDGQAGFERTTAGPSTSMRYASPREDTVTVRVVDRTGLSDSASEHLSVIGGEERLPPPSSAATSSVRARARGAGGLGSRLPFEAEVRGGRGTRQLARGRMYAWLPELPRRLSWAERTFQRFLYAPWRARIKVRRDRASGRVEVSGVALARAKVEPRAGRALRKRRKAVVACLRLRLHLRPGVRPAGRLTVLGGRGPAARLRGTARFRFVVTEDGIGSVRGTLRARRGPKHAAPRACRVLLR